MSTARRSRTALPHFLTLLGPLCWFTTCCLVFPLAAAAQAATSTNAPKAPLSSNRYLIIVETSRNMERRAEGTLQAVHDLLVAMRSQLHRGDTIGLWTYNDQLYAGRFPLQHWTPETHRAVAGRLLTYLKEQPFEKSAKLDSALTVMDRIIKNSGFITVFIVSDGEQRIRGTPFDQTINANFKSWKQQQQKARMPFVTLLRANKGQIIEHSVTSSPWPVELPPLPPEAIPVAVADTPPPAAPAAPKPTIVAPLIISGKKKNPPPPATTPDVTTTPGAVPQTQSATPSPIALAPVTTSTPPPVDSTPPRQAITPTEPAAPGNARSTAPEPPAFTSGNAAPPNAASLATTSNTDTNSFENKAAPSIDQAATGPSDGNPEKKVNASASESEPVSPAPIPTREVIALAGEPLFGQKAVVIAGLVVAAFVVGLGLMAMRRSRPSPHTSFITRSFDRENK